jgi:hypothetical protein
MMVDFINTYGNIISTVMGGISIVVAVIGVYYGRKASITASQIYKDGIKNNKDKICKQVGLEFVVHFINPFVEFKYATNKIWYESNFNDTNVMYVRDTLKDHFFKVEFPYYEQNKGEIWYAFSELTENKQAEAFKIVSEFVVTTKAFNEGIKTVLHSLDKFLSNNGNIDKHMVDFFKADDVNKSQFENGIKAMAEVDKHIEKLSTILEIETLKSNLKKY